MVAELKKVIYDILASTTKGTLKEEAAIKQLKKLQDDEGDGFPAVLLDTAYVMEIETSAASSDDTKADERQRFISLLKEISTIFLSEQLLKERVEFDVLEDVGILPNKKVYNTKLIKLKTKLYYKQQKFNLLREESDGYSKLITELNQDVPPSPQYLLKVIKSLIGCFNLDPNRVLDIVLESFECRPDHHQFFVQLLRLYMSDEKTLCEVLGMKFGLYRSETCPSSLYRVTALLIQNNVIGLDHIWPWLVPDDALMKEVCEAQMKEAKEYSRKLNALVTTPSNKPDAKDDSVPAAVKFSRNQKLGLLELLLKVGDWEHSNDLMNNRMPPFFAVTHPPIVQAICTLVHSTMEPIYRLHSGLSSRLKGKSTQPITNPLAPQPVSDVGGFVRLVVPMILSMGPHLKSDLLLIYKIVRVFRNFCETTPPVIDFGKPLPQIHIAALNVLDEVLLPCLSLLDCHCVLAEELWSLIKLFPYQFRYRLYHCWKNEGYMKHPILIRRKGEALKKVKLVMKRVTKETVKPTGRTIGKLSHSTPCFLFDYVLTQIQQYDNLIGPVVDSLRFLTGLGYDVIGFCLVEALSKAEEKRKIKSDGTSISLWLQNLASFSGAVFKKYSIELTPILQYVANQLKRKKCLDLLILKEIVHKMSGIEATEEMTDDQLSAMTGGELLRSEAGYFSQVRNTKKSSTRLKEALLEANLDIPLCLLMAQQRNAIIFEQLESSHVKLAGNLYDQCQDTLVQFGTFLASNLSIEDYAKRLPNISELLSTYHLDADSAFFLATPMFNHKITMKFDSLRKQEKNPKAKATLYTTASNSVLSPVADTLKTRLLTSKTWEEISPQLFLTFWSLSMQDLLVPRDVYEKEISRLKVQMQQIGENKDMPSSKRKKEQERCNQLVEKLQEEEKKQEEHVERVLHRLNQEKDTWFPRKTTQAETFSGFIQLCLLPRATFTAGDAVFCARFLSTMHQLKTPNFVTVMWLDRIFNDLTFVITSCTEGEVHRYGRFLSGLLETIMRWHGSKTIYEKECSNHPGFFTKVRLQQSVTNKSGTPECNTQYVPFDEYKPLVQKWHYRFTKALVICLESCDYVQIRNALIVMRRVLPSYPVTLSFATALDKRIEVVQNNEKDKRPDLYVLATSYRGQLQARKPSIMADEPLKPPPKTKPSTPKEKTQSSDTAKQEAQKPAEEPKEPERKVPKTDHKTESQDINDNHLLEKAIKESKEKSNGLEKKVKHKENGHKKEEKRLKEEKVKAKGSPKIRAHREEGEEERENSVSSSQGSTAPVRRNSQEPGEEREVKRRKTDSSGGSAKVVKEEKKAKRGKSKEKKEKREAEHNKKKLERKRVRMNQRNRGDEVSRKEYVAQEMAPHKKRREDDRVRASSGEYRDYQDYAPNDEYSHRSSYDYPKHRQDRYNKYGDQRGYEDEYYEPQEREYRRSDRY